MLRGRQKRRSETVLTQSERADALNIIVRNNVSKLICKSIL